MKTNTNNIKTTLSTIIFPIIGVMLILSAFNVKAESIPSCQVIGNSKQIDICIKDLRNAKKTLQKAEKAQKKQIANLKKRQSLEAKLVKLQEKLKNL